MPIVGMPVDFHFVFFLWSAWVIFTQNIHHAIYATYSESVHNEHRKNLVECGNFHVHARTRFVSSDCIQLPSPSNLTEVHHKWKGTQENMKMKYRK